MLKENFKIKEDDLDVLQLIHEDPKISQRKIANKLGLSLGKVNYCIKSLSKVGFIKLKNFSGSNNKKLYMYLLTPKAIIEKTRITKKFIEAKKEEFDKLHSYLE